MGKRITGWIEIKLEQEMMLKINREKTRIVKMNEPGASLNFLGFTLRYDADSKGSYGIEVNGGADLSERMKAFMLD